MIWFKTTLVAAVVFFAGASSSLHADERSASLFEEDDDDLLRGSVVLEGNCHKKFPFDKLRVKAEEVTYLDNAFTVLSPVDKEGIFDISVLEFRSYELKLVYVMPEGEATIGKFSYDYRTPLRVPAFPLKCSDYFYQPTLKF